MSAIPYPLTMFGIQRSLCYSDVLANKRKKKEKPYINSHVKSRWDQILISSTRWMAKWVIYIEGLVPGTFCRTHRNVPGQGLNPDEAWELDEWVIENTTIKKNPTCFTEAHGQTIYDVILWMLNAIQALADIVTRRTANWNHSETDLLISVWCNQ